MVTAIGVSFFKAMKIEVPSFRSYFTGKKDKVTSKITQIMRMIPPDRRAVFLITACTLLLNSITFNLSEKGIDKRG